MYLLLLDFLLFDILLLLLDESLCPFDNGFHACETSEALVSFFFDGASERATLAGFYEGGSGPGRISRDACTSRANSVLLFHVKYALPDVAQVVKSLRVDVP